MLVVLNGLLAGYAEVCTNDMNGGGGTNYQVTKDCCAAVRHHAYFSEVARQSWPYSGPAGNDVDGAMVRCCSTRGARSKAV